jgi:hypothetical protein
MEIQNGGLYRDGVFVILKSLMSVEITIESIDSLEMYKLMLEQ